MTWVDTRAGLGRQHVLGLRTGGDPGNDPDRSDDDRWVCSELSKDSGREIGGYVVVRIGDWGGILEEKGAWTRQEGSRTS